MVFEKAAIDFQKQVRRREKISFVSVADELEHFSVQRFPRRQMKDIQMPFVSWLREIPVPLSLGHRIVTAGNATKSPVWPFPMNLRFKGGPSNLSHNPVSDHSASVFPGTVVGIPAAPVCQTHIPGKTQNRSVRTLRSKSEIPVLRPGSECPGTPHWQKTARPQIDTVDSNALSARSGVQYQTARAAIPGQEPQSAPELRNRRCFSLCR